MPLMKEPRSHRAGLRRSLARQQRKTANRAALAQSTGYRSDSEKERYERTRGR